jgi:phage shock protein C
MEPTTKKFFRSRNDRIIFGVAGGLAKYFEIDPTLVRVVFVLLALTGSFGVLLYIILAIITPLEPGEGINTDTRGNFKNFAHEVAGGAQKIAEEMKGDVHSTKNILGLFIIAVGLVLLLQNLFHFAVRWSIFSPFLIIIFGLFLIAKHK